MNMGTKVQKKRTRQIVESVFLNTKLFDLFDGLLDAIHDVMHIFICDIGS